MKGSRYLAVVAVLVVSSFARAADLPVTYTVDDKALKAAVAGTNVTFDLYTDSACAGPIAHTETVPIENVELISKLKLGVPKGAMVKPPKTDELHHTLTGVTGSGNLYLKVSGTGVVPVGTDCQVQSASIQTGSISSPPLTKSIQFGVNGCGPFWGIVHAAPELPSGTDLLVTDAHVANVLNSLNHSLPYACDVQVSSDFGVYNLCGAHALTVFSIANCTPAPTPIPTVTPSPTPTTTATPQGPAKVAFVTSTAQSGNLGGLAGGDTICNALAANAGLPGAYLAWLADTTGSPSTRFSQTGHYVRVDGTIIAYNWGDLTDGQIRAPISVTEQNNSVGPSCVWSDVYIDGTFSDPNACNNWSSIAVSGGFGNSSSSSSSWTSGGFGNCASNCLLYCFQQ